MTVDAVILLNNRKDIVLIRRKNAPFQGQFALPGGFVDVGETVENACIRESKEETNINVKILNLIGVFSDPKRDPRGHTISIIYELKIINGKIISGDDASEVDFFKFDNIPQKLSFDHKKIISDYLKEVK